MKTMNVREFLRGEYRNLREPTLVMNYSRPIGVWQPVSGLVVTGDTTTSLQSTATASFMTYSSPTEDVSED